MILAANECKKCGGEAEFIELFPKGRRDCFIRCKGCGYETRTYVNRKGAILAWNKGKVYNLSDPTLTTSEKIRQLRESCGMTQREVARQLGVCVGTVRVYEKGDSDVPFFVMTCLADLFGTSLDYLAGREEN